MKIYKIQNLFDYWAGGFHYDRYFACTQITEEKHSTMHNQKKKIIHQLNRFTVGAIKLKQKREKKNRTHEPKLITSDSKQRNRPTEIHFAKLKQKYAYQSKQKQKKRREKNCYSFEVKQFCYADNFEL